MQGGRAALQDRRRRAHARLIPGGFALLLTAVLAAPPSLLAQEYEAVEPPAGDAPIPGSHRLFFLPTGRTLPAGTAEAGAYELLAPYLGYAFHDRVMLSFGTPILPEAFARYWYVAPKIGVLALPRWQAAVGGLVIVEAGDPFASGSGGELGLLSPFVWGVITYGGPAAAITAGVTTDVGDFTELSNDKLFLVGAELEVWRRGPAWDGTGIRLIAESYLEWPFAASAFDPSVTVAGFRLVEGTFALEVVTLFTAQDGVIEFINMPLVHFSVLF